MQLRSFVSALSWALLAGDVTGMAMKSGKPDEMIKPYGLGERAQDIVTWDQHSIMIRGERIMLFNGEFHPYRLPVPALWLDIFQKLKAAGYAGVSFYTDMALHEGKQGNFTADGVFDLVPFFAAAAEAGIYLVARPGPYINAESSGGGYPGWLSRYKAHERTPAYVPFTENYVNGISSLIAKAQITNGGPVILLQPENEYSQAVSGVTFPNHEYFQMVENQYRNAGIVVPFVSNDAYPHGYFAPGTGQGAVDIYGYDGYPLGFDCANPYTWPAGDLPNYYLDLHEQQAPGNPNTISEFQGGSFDPWGGEGFLKCSELLNEEFERVFYKNNYGGDVTIMNMYMVYGGTNWGNLGHPGGYTSYDYGAIIKEDRTVTREKYSEIKLQTNFFKVSPAYLTATPHNANNGSYTTTPMIATTQLAGNGTQTNMYVVRQAAYNSYASTEYKLVVPTSKGTITIPQLSGNLVINGRDSKIQVTDYDVGGINMLYSSAEIFTWKKYSKKTVLVLYAGPNETHEAAFTGQQKPVLTDGSGVTIANKNGSWVLNWQSSPARRLVKFPSGLYVYLLDRNNAYNWWVLDLPATSPTSNYTHPNAESLIVHAGYLVRTASLSGSTVALTGDLNATVPLEVIGGAPSNAKVTWNGKPVKTTQNADGVVSGTLTFTKPDVSAIDMTKLSWKYLNSLPEIQNNYSDAAWPAADLTYTNNTVRNITTPVSLYGSDYAFNTGVLLSRGHFEANGGEKTLELYTQGGTAYAASVWLNDTFLGSWAGNSAEDNYNQTLTLPTLKKNTKYVLTVVNDNMGLDEDGTVGSDGNKDPRGILNYVISGQNASNVIWKITGNLGGENYADHSRGPLNEGGTYAERQGYHQPGAPYQDWADSTPFDGLSAPGIGFYATTFKLNVPAGYDVPMSFQFTNTSSPSVNYRVQLFVNGWQFGKYVNNIGPQTLFPVQQGILNYQGDNYVSMTLWATDAAGAKLGDLSLVPTGFVQSGYGFENVGSVNGQTWVKRPGAY